MEALHSKCAGRFVRVNFPDIGMRDGLIVATAYDGDEFQFFEFSGKRPFWVATEHIVKVGNYLKAGNTGL